MPAERIFCAAIAALSGAGLFLQSGIPEGRPRKTMFVYYTNLSNLVIFVYHVLLLACGFRGGRLYRFLNGAGVRMSMTLCIWVTHLIFHFVLRPYFKNRRGRFDDAGFAVGNALVHYIVPLACVAEWVLCADKNAAFADCLAWLAIPCAYFVFVLIFAAAGGRVGGNGARYPYPFIDRDALGTGRFLRNAAIALLGFFALSLLLYAAAALLR